MHYFIERFINLCKSKRIFLWNSKRKKATLLNTNIGINDFKKIYTAANKDLAELYANEFLDKYKDKSSIIKHAKVYIDEIMPLFDLPINIRKYVYTNNIVESVNSKIQRGFYGRGALPNAESAINIIYVNLIDLEKKWNKSKVTNWDKIFSEIQIVHKNIIDEYLK